MTTRRPLRDLLLLTGLIIGHATAAPLPGPLRLDTEFASPPASAKPWTFWIWVNGNITKAGIDADLADMKRAGIGGAMLFDQGIHLPAGPVPYGTEDWYDCMQHALETAGKLGLKIAVMNCPGWATSGGPWIDADHSMKVLTWSEQAVPGGGRWNGAVPLPNRKLDYYRDIAVFAVPARTGRIPLFSRKTGLNGEGDLSGESGQSSAGGPSVAPGEVIDLRAAMTDNGQLSWDAPPGDWTVIRLGYTSTASRNHPAVPQGDGLEVDKLDPAAVELHFQHALGRIFGAARASAISGLAGIMCDSWEAGPQNWTARLPEYFERRRGYSLFPFLPCLAGRIVGSSALTEAFLDDFRRTLGDLYAQNYFGTFQQLAHKDHLRLFAEPYGGVMDEFKSHRFIDAPMVEFWNHSLYKGFDAAVSVAHTTGKSVMAEAFTARPPRGEWDETPFSIKALGDRAFAAGVTTMVLSEYIHQPRSDVGPGFTQGRYGTHFGRLNSWWPLAGGWIDYLRRCQYLLGQGSAASDLLFFRPDALQTEKRDLTSPAPGGFHGDFVSADQLEMATVVDGKIGLGLTWHYPLLVLPHHWRTGVSTLRRLVSLRASGARIIGPPPDGPEGVIDLTAGAKEWADLVQQLWNGPAGTSIPRGNDPSVILAELGLAPDFRFSSSNAGAAMEFIHRSTPDAEIYFISNQTGRSIAGEAEFRINRRVPEMWDAKTGAITEAAGFLSQAGLTKIPLSLETSGSRFIVFRRPLPNGIGEPQLQRIRPSQAQPSITIDGPWQVTFEKHRGAPDATSLDHLRSLSLHPNPGIRYFSGLATYTAEFRVPWSAAKTVSHGLLSLGEVHDVASVAIDGQLVGILWCPPYAIDVTSHLAAGPHRLAVTVANTWVNRMVGDEQLPAEASYLESGPNDGRGALMEFPRWWSDPALRALRPRISFVTWKVYNRATPLEPAGLIGPVTIALAP